LLRTTESSVYYPKACCGFVNKKDSIKNGDVFVAHENENIRRLQTWQSEHLPIAILYLNCVTACYYLISAIIFGHI
jgi:hypothetical protein